MKRVTFNDIVEVKYFSRDKPATSQVSKQKNRVPYIYGILFIVLLLFIIHEL
jgi:hypothetical protein